MSEPQAKYEAKKDPKPYELIVGNTMTRINALQQSRQIHFPEDYSPQNALQSAYLILQRTTATVRKGPDQFDKVPVLTHCTQASIANALLDMVIQGFNPVKKQCAFIAYGKQLSCQPEYFGNMMLAKRADPRIADDGIVAEVIFKKDELEYEIVHGKRHIVKHVQRIENMKYGDIIGAYCQVITSNGEILKTEIMTYEEIEQAWKKSRNKPFDKQGKLKPDSTHAEFKVEMCKKTVINRACKTVINSSSDKILMEAYKRQTFIEAEGESVKQIKEGSGRQVIDMGPIGEIEEEGPPEEEDFGKNEEAPGGQGDENTQEEKPPNDDLSDPGF